LGIQAGTRSDSDKDLRRPSRMHLKVAHIESDGPVDERHVDRRKFNARSAVLGGDMLCFPRLGSKFRCSRYFSNSAVPDDFGSYSVILPQEPFVFGTSHINHGLFLIISADRRIPRTMRGE
jgi:hypothetical protein